MVEITEESVTPVRFTDHAIKSNGFRSTRTTLDDICPDDQCVGSIKDAIQETQNEQTLFNNWDNATDAAIEIGEPENQTPASTSGNSPVHHQCKGHAKVTNSAIEAFNREVRRLASLRGTSNDNGMTLPSTPKRSQSQPHTPGAIDIPDVSTTYYQGVLHSLEIGDDKTLDDGATRPRLPPLGLIGSKAWPNRGTPNFSRMNEEGTDRSTSTTSYMMLSGRSDSSRIRERWTTNRYYRGKMKRRWSSKVKKRAHRKKEMSKKEFEKCLDILRKWYAKLRIINDQNSRIANGSSAEAQIKPPTMVERDNSLDIKFALGHVTDYLTCTLCKGLFHNAHTIKECMHTFCKSCLVMYTVEYGLSCPKCHEPLPVEGMEGVGYDNNIQGLVDKLFPSFNKREMQQRDQLKAMIYPHVENEGDLYISVDMNSERSEEPPNSQPVENSMMLASKYRKMFYEHIKGNGGVVMDTVPDNVTFVALLHEDDHPEIQLQVFDVDTYLGNQDHTVDDTESCAPSETNNKGKYEGIYIGIPRYTPVSELCRFIASIHKIADTLKVELTLEGTLMHENHTVDFICRIKGIDMTKCVMLRFKVVEKEVVEATKEGSEEDPEE